MNKIDLNAIRILRQTKSDKEIWVCKRCGSPRLDQKVWADYNTSKIYDSTYDDEVYCNTCETHMHCTELQTLEEWKHKDTVYRTREEAIQDLAEKEEDGMSGGDTIDILTDGCPGWKAIAFSDVDLINFYQQYFGKTLVITLKEIRT